MSRTVVNLHERATVQTYNEISAVNCNSESEVICGEQSLEVNVDVVKSLRVIENSAKDKMYNFVKRAFDISIGLVGLLMMLPVCIIIRIAYLCDGDTESIFFTQNRIGENGKIIKIYKFRSMIPHAEEVLEKLMSENPAIKEEYLKNKKLKNDPRITKLGKFIRKTSLDELPQFINILKGNMTIVGPRPYLPREKADMGEYYFEIIENKPGLTGLWQVEGRSNLGFRGRCKLDKFYNKHKGVKFDLYIFFKTFITVINKNGAR